MSSITLITDARKGLGRFLTQEYLGRGHQVVGCSREKPDFEHENFHYFQADVWDEASVIKIMQFVAKKFGRLDYLINTAGIGSMSHSSLTPVATVERIMNVNMLGTFLFCREAARLMQEQKSGRIVNFSSVAVPMRLEGDTIYAATKSAVETMTKVLAKELGAHGVTVNAVAPGPMEIDLTRAVPNERFDAILAAQSIKRLASLDDIVNAVDFFLNERSDFVTGQVLYLGGV